MTTPRHSDVMTNLNPPNRRLFSNYPVIEGYVTFVAGFSFLCIGLLRAYTSPAILSMKEEPELLNSTSLTPNQVISWVASSPPIGGFLGTLLSGPLLQHAGRKGTIFLLTWPLICGWLIIRFAGISIILILIGRFLTGFAAGLATASAQLYISECVRAEVRGTLGFLPAMMLALGVLLGFLLGAVPSLDWRNLALVMATFPVTLLAMIMTIPESPSWFIMKGREELASKSLIKLRGNVRNNEEIEKELAEMRMVLIKDTKSGESASLWKLVRHRSVWYPGSVAVLLMIFQQLTGANVVIFYLSVIFTSATPQSFQQFVASHNMSIFDGHQHGKIVYGLDTSISSVVIGVVQFLAFFISLPMIDRLGRRILLVSSALAMSIPQGSLGFYYFCNQPQFFLESPVHTTCATFVESTGTWLPLTCLSVFIAAYSIGFGPICFILMSELFPSQVRSYLCSVTSFVNFFSIFLLIRGFPPALDSFGPHWIFWTFSGSCLLSIIFVLVMVPETKGKTLAEIEHSFRKSTSTTNSVVTN